MLPVDVAELVRAAGYVGIAAIVFAESGVLVGFFLPGDSLLFTAGFLASRGQLDLAVLLPLCFLAAVAGDSVGYSFGRRAGRRLFDRPRSRVFRPERLAQAEAFFAARGGQAIVLARFLPWVRTFTPVAAGVGRMPYRRFLSFNVIGALAWATGMPLAGYFLGAAVDDADVYVLPAVLVVIAVSAGLTSRRMFRAAREASPSGPPELLVARQTSTESAPQ